MDITVGDSTIMKKIFLFSIFLFFLFIISAHSIGLWYAFSAKSAQRSGDPYKNNLVLRYSFDTIPWTNSLGGIKDVSGNALDTNPNNDGTNPQKIAGTNSFGEINYYYPSYNANNNPIIMGKTNLWSIITTNGWPNGITISTWIYGKSNITYPNYFFLYDTTTNFIYISGYEGNLWSRVNRGPSTLEVSLMLPNYSSFTFSNWYNLTATYSVNNFRFYTNGILMGADTSCSTFPTNQLWYLYFYVGFYGMDDCKIYNIALNSNDVYNMYQYTIPTNNIWMNY